MIPARSPIAPRLAAICALLGLALAGCQGAPSALDPHGPDAARTADLWWIAFWISAVVCLLIFGLVLLAALRGRETPRAGGGWAFSRPGTLREAPWLVVVVIGGIIIPIVVLFTMQVFTLRAMASLIAPPQTPTLDIEVVGHQYWWEVRYPQQGITTANEIHIPAGQPVRLTLESQDVIHSFWVPQLRGKMDVVPGHRNVTWLQADQPGTYRGQCAEFCGMQHAHMAFLVVAEAPPQFDAWQRAQQQPASQPSEPFLQRGASVFAQQGCIQCHAIRYGDRIVGGHVGPDLTHVGSRTTLAAGTLDNNLGNMAGWIGNPQALKPGNVMPVIPMGADDLRAVAMYLESLK